MHLELASLVSPTRGIAVSLALRYGLWPACIGAALVLGCSDTGSAGAASVGGTSSSSSIATNSFGGVMSSGGRGGANNSQQTAQGGATLTGGASNPNATTSGSATATGGSLATGGALATGGHGSGDPTGGRAATGSVASTGGAVSTGGAPASGGSKSAGGTNATSGMGGMTSAAGSKLTGGTSAIGGSSGAGATGGASAAGSSSNGPCDIYAAANTPCVAAHSTTRALYGAYGGKVYQVRRASDKATRDILVVSPGSYADSATQDTFCVGTTCTISTIYDQSSNGNHLSKSPAGGWLKNGGLEADATAAKIKLNGHTVYGVYTTMNWDDSVGAVGYRRNDTKGIATGDQPETMYMVVSGKRYNQWCCFDYGNAETNNLDNGKATMEAVYFGNSTQWGKGSGAGPWVMADLEDGIFAGGSTAAAPTNTSLIADYVTAMLKGYSGNRFVLKGGSSQSGTLATKYDGARPAGYSPQKKEGAIVLGTGGDNSHTGEGTFFEGCMTAGVPADATDDAVQANIVAAGYGR